MRIIRQFFKLIWYFSLLIQVLLVVVYFRFYHQVNEPEVPVPPKLDRAIRETVEQLPAQLPRPDIAQKPLLVLPLVGDRQELLTTALRKVIDDEAQYRTVDRSTLDQLLARVGLQDRVVVDVEKAIQLGKAAEAEVVILGRVTEMSMTETKSLVDFTAQAYQVSDATPLFKTERFTNIPPEPEPTAPVATGPPLDLWFLLGLGCFCLFWPILQVPVIQQVVARESNGLTGLALVGLVAVPLALGWYVVMGDSTSVLRIVLLIVFSVATSLWCTFVMNQVAAEQTV